MEKENALKILRELHDKALFSERTALETFIPELKESEDERIRKEIIAHCRNTRCVTEEGAERIAKWIAWLEKQGEQNDSDVKDYNSIDPHFAKPADKVEPKFKVGDWITDDEDEVIFHITSYDIDYGYQLETVNGTSFHYSDETIEKKYRLWTIADAKDGDILCTPNGNTFIFKTIDGDKILDYCGLYFNKFFSDSGSPNGSSTHYDKCNYHPATKEQRDLLFQKIHEAGYEWDEEKKELKKIEQKSWSEEDEKMFKSLKTLLNNASCYSCTEGVDKILSWLNSLRPQPKQEWSEEDECTLNGILDDYKSMCKTYRNWLESLKNRIQPQQKQEWSEEDENNINSIVSRLEVDISYWESRSKTRTNEDKKLIGWLKSLRPQSKRKWTLETI